MPGVLRVIWKDVSNEKMLLPDCLVVCVLPWSMIDMREHSQLWAGDPGVFKQAGRASHELQASNHKSSVVSASVPAWIPAWASLPDGLGFKVK